MNTDGHPLRTALVTSAFPLGGGAVGGGVEGVCYYLAHALARDAGLRVHVFVALAEHYGFERYTRIQNNGLTVHAVPSKAKRSRLLAYLLLDPAALLKRASETGFDVVHVQNDASWAARTRLPSVLTIHGINERDTLFRGRRLTRALRGWANRVFNCGMRRHVRNIIAVSPYVRQVLKASARQRIWDIENPVADTFFELIREPVAGRVLFAGRITPLKNVAGLIEGFALATKDNSDCELRLAGAEPDSAYATQCRALAAQLRVGERVRFLGALRIEDLQSEFARASVLALCSFQENAPLVISEAMAAGVPVVASNVCGIPWMVAEGATGYLVNPALPEDIARGLGLALQTREPGQMGARAKAEAERRFRASAVAQRTVEVYRNILAHEAARE